MRWEEGETERLRDAMNGIACEAERPQQERRAGLLGEAGWPSLATARAQ